LEKRKKPLRGGRDHIALQKVGTAKWTEGGRKTYRGRRRHFLSREAKRKRGSQEGGRGKIRAERVKSNNDRGATNLVGEHTDHSEKSDYMEVGCSERLRW